MVLNDRQFYERKQGRKCVKDRGGSGYRVN